MSGKKRSEMEDVMGAAQPEDQTVPVDAHGDTESDKCDGMEEKERGGAEPEEGAGPSAESVAGAQYPIFLRDIWTVANPTDYKVHFASWNGKHHPLDRWVLSPKEWEGWQIYRGRKNRFPRRFVFSLMDFYHERDCWLFGGVFEIVGRHVDHYDVELTDAGAAYVGRLKIRSPYKGRTREVNFEHHYCDGRTYTLEVREILPEPYSGRAFPGYSSINLSFDEMNGLILRERQDWKTTLSAVNGEYMITDCETNKRYVGSAYGGGGVWSRWEQYASIGHGGNKQLTELLRRKGGMAYAQRNFRFVLLERCPDASNEEVIRRESYWKKALLTREAEFGYNDN